VRGAAHQFDIFAQLADFHREALVELGVVGP
jgi:hypothetical protein